MEKLLEAFDQTKEAIIENIQKIDVSLKNLNGMNERRPEKKRETSQLILNVLQKFVDIRYTLETLVIENGFENPQDISSIEYNNSSEHPSIVNQIDIPTNLTIESVQINSNNNSINHRNSNNDDNHNNNEIVQNTQEDVSCVIVEESSDTTPTDNQENVDNCILSNNNQIDNTIEIPERDCVDVETKKDHSQSISGTANKKLLNSNFRNRIKEAQRLLQQRSTLKSFSFRSVDKSSEFFQQRVLIPKKKIVGKPTYELDDDSLRACMSCWVSFIVSPSEFYVRTDEELFNVLQSELNEEINKKHFLVEFNYNSKNEAMNTVGDYCAAYIPLKSAFYRVHVYDWGLNDSSNVVHIYLVDTGEKSFCSYKNLIVLDDKFKEAPKLAIRCHFKALYPISGDVWTEKVRRCFTELTHNKRKPKELYMIYVEKSEDSYGVDFCEKGTDNPSIATILIEKGLAINNDDDDVDDDEEEETNDDNDYEDSDDDDLVEYDNINQAVTGYDARDEARICPFTDNDGKCFKGASCKLEHIKRSNDWTTTDKVLTATSAFQTLELPSAGDTVLMTFTNFKNSCRFYINIINKKDENFHYDVKLVNLLKELNSTQNIITFKSFDILPAVGEIVLFNSEKVWYRGQYLGTGEKDSVGEVFSVDFGNVVICSLKNIRKIEDKYLHLPFQAIECVFHGYREKAGTDQKRVQDFVRNHFFFKVFYADVITPESPLSLQVFDRDSDIGLMLKELGFVENYDQLKPESNSVLQVE